jgi:hypothetical protein
MAHARLTASRAAFFLGRVYSSASLLVASAFACTFACACGDSASANAARPLPIVTSGARAAPRADEPQAFPDEPHRLQHFHSKRFSLTIPFPDGKAWRIDDHTTEALIATHAATSSTLTVSILADPDELMTRQKCEALARQQKLVPGSQAQMRTVADERTYAMDSFDTRVWVAVEPPSAPARPLVGHVLAFGGYIHKCFFFHYATSVSGANGEDVLSSRLALVRTRILGGMKVDEFAEVPRQKPNLDK